MELSRLLESLLPSLSDETEAGGVPLPEGLARGEAFRTAARSQLDSISSLIQEVAAKRGVTQNVIRLGFYEAVTSVAGGRREAPASFRVYAPLTSSVDGSVTEHDHAAGDEIGLALMSDVWASADNETERVESYVTLQQCLHKEAPEFEADLRGFVAFFTAKTSFPVDDCLLSIVVALAGLVAHGSRPLVAENATTISAGMIATLRQRLSRLYLLLYQIVKGDGPSSTFLVPAEACSFAHSFEVAFRLLLQYHDPSLSVALDQLRVDIGSYAFRWLRSLCLDHCVAESLTPSVSGSKFQATNRIQRALRLVETDRIKGATVALWDCLVAHSGSDSPDKAQGPLLVVFLILVSLIEQRESLLNSSNSSNANNGDADPTARVKAKLGTLSIAAAFTRNAGGNGSRSSTPPMKSPTSSVVPSLTVLPPCASARDLLQKSLIAWKHTPSTAKRLFSALVAPDATQLQRDPHDVREEWKELVALPVDAEEMVSAFRSPNAPRTNTPPAPSVHTVSYVVLDCRSSDSYHFARLPTALHVGDTIGFDAKLIAQLLQRFENAKGSHLCVLGTGRLLVEESNLLKLTVLHFVQAGFPYVSFARGGFKALIPFIKQGVLEYVKTPASMIKASRPAAKPSPAEGSLHCVPVAPSEPSTKAPLSDPPHPAVVPQSTASGFAVAREEVAAKAEEIRQKTATWGWGLVQSIKSKVAEVHLMPRTHQGPPSEPQTSATVRHADAAANGGIVESAKVTESQPRSPASGNTVPKISSMIPTELSEAQSQRQDTKKSDSGPSPHQQLFSVSKSHAGEDDDDDDMGDLITVMPAVAVAAVVSPSPSQPSASSGGEKPAVQQQPHSPANVNKREHKDDDEEWIELPSISSSPAPKAPAPETAFKPNTTESTTSSVSAARHPFDDIFV